MKKTSAKLRTFLLLRQWFSPDNKEEKALEKKDEKDNVSAGNVKTEEGIASDVIEKVEEELTEVPAKVNKRNPPGIMSVMSSSLEILQARVTRSRLAGDPPDILIEPQLTDVGIMEFHRAEELCAKGEETIARLAEQIRYQLLT